MTALATTTTKQESLVAATARDLGIKQSELDLIKDVYAKNATDEELALFLRTAKRLGLDPTARQIYLVKRWDGGLKREVATPQTSIDGFRLIADRTERYVPGREATFTYAGNNELESATAYVKKYVHGEWHEISATAFYNEYVQKTKEGRPNSMWGKMPHLMLAKCAESLALRKAFPAELSGIYTQEETGSTDNGLDQPRPATKLELVEQARQQLPAEPEVIEAEPVEDQTAEARRNMFLDTVAELCKRLNAAGDSIKWSGKQLKEYVNTQFDVADGLDSLSFESFDELVRDLEGRLNYLTAEK